MLNRRKMLSWIGLGTAAAVAKPKLNLDFEVVDEIGVMPEMKLYTSCCISDFGEIVTATLRNRSGRLFESVIENNAPINRLKRDD